MEQDAVGEDLVFRAKKGSGEPLVRSIWQDGKHRRCDTIKCMMWRLQQRVGINDGRAFYALRKTGATMIERINPAATEMYLAHSEKGMKKNYAERDWEALDQVLTELDDLLRLGHDEACR